MSEQILRDEIVTIRPGANQRLDSDEEPRVRMIRTATRVLVSAWNSAADELIDGELTFDVEQLREFVS